VQYYDNQNRINKQLKASRTFHQTLSVHDREPTTRVRLEPGKVSLLIPSLENNTDFLLQEFTLKRKIDTTLQVFHRTLGVHNQRSNVNQTQDSKKTLDRAAVDVRAGKIGGSKKGEPLMMTGVQRREIKGKNNMSPQDFT
jgi:hypothetical protein